MLPQATRNYRRDRKQLRQFGLTTGIILAVLAGFFYWREERVYPYLLILAGLFLIAGAVAPILLKPLHKVWMVLAVPLGWLVTRLVMVILFYAVFTPYSLIARLLGKQFIEQKWDRSAKSYWVLRE